MLKTKEHKRQKGDDGNGGSEGGARTKAQYLSHELAFTYISSPNLILRL